MGKQTKRKNSERGVALIFALLAILVLSILAVAILGTSMAQNWTSYNYRLTAQARYAAETGVQQTMNWLASASYTTPVLASFTLTTNPVNCLAVTCTTVGSPVVLSATSGVSSNYPVASVATAFATAMSGTLPTISATYTTSAKLLRMSQLSSASWLPGGGGVSQTWQITSVGSIAGVRSATVQLTETFETSTKSIFSAPLDATGTGCGSVTLDNSADSTDSYNSALGTTFTAQYPGGVGGSQGNIVSSGNINVSNGVKVNGSVTGVAPGSGTCAGAIKSGSGTVTGSTTTNTLPAPPLPWGCSSQPCYPSSPAALTTSQNISSGCTGITGCTVGGKGRDGTGSATSVTVIDGGSSQPANVFTLAPGAYGNITIDGADVVHVTAGTYAINSINFTGDAQFVVDSGPVILNLAGNCASGCPSESISSMAINGTTSNVNVKEVIYGAGYAGFNGCTGGVTANPDIYSTANIAKACGSARTPFSGVASQMQIVYGGTNTIRLGGMPNALVFYAPAAGYFTPGGAVGLFGSIVVKEYEDQSGSPFHYDMALQTTVLQASGFKPVGGFSWNTF